MKNYKTIAIFNFSAEYAVLRLLFDQAQIRYVFQNETMMSVLPIYTNSRSGGIRLQVHFEDIEEATEILKALDRPSNLNII